MLKKTKKIRNYSFKESKRLAQEKLVEVNGIKIPAMTGTCYHGIMCALASNKDRFIPWNKICELVERYMCQYGGGPCWEKFRDKEKQSPEQRIKDNVHTLTRSGKDCYGFRLHEMGMAIYFFRDGAMLLTGGKFNRRGSKYDVVFPDGRQLQARHRGMCMTLKEYQRFLDLEFIDASGNVLNSDGIKQLRTRHSISKFNDGPPTTVLDENTIEVCIVLSEKFDQSTADRLEKIGLVVDYIHGNELIGRIGKERLSDLKKDRDVVEVDPVGV